MPQEHAPLSDAAQRPPPSIRRTRALDRLPGWEATRPQWHPEERLWAASAFYAGSLRRFAARPAVESRGTTEAGALRELAGALRGW